MKTKNVLKTLVLVLLMFAIFCVKVNAASISGNSSVNIGDTFTITFEFGTSVAAYDSINVSYDTNMYEYVSGDALSESVWWDQTDASNGITTKSYTFKALKEGSSRIMVVAKGVTSANETMDVLGTLTAEKMISATSTTTQTEENNTSSTQTQTTTTTTDTSNTVALNSNNYLKYLQISEEGLTPYFTRNVTNYSLAVGENVSQIDVLARAEDTNASVEVYGNDNIVDGDNTIEIKVTAQNGDVKRYFITVTKTENKETSNAYLETLIVENYNLDKTFQSEVLEYDLGDIPTTVSSLNVVAIAKAEQANIEIIGANSLQKNGEITIRVTAQDGQTVREYKLKYNYIDASEEQVEEALLTDYLKNIQSSQGTKDKIVAYLKYIWLAIKKNYLLVIMYALIIIEFIQIVILRRKLSKQREETPPPDGKEFLKVEIPKEEKQEKLVTDTQNAQKIEPPQITPLKEESVLSDSLPIRHGSVQNRADGIKLVDLDKDEGPQDELTFNIFDNLNDDDIKRMLSDEIDKEE